MGCTSTRLNVTYEEAAVINGENLLLYYQHDVSIAVAALKEVAKDHHVSKKDWQKVSEKLKLGYSSTDASAAKVQDFFKHFLHDKNFELKDLTLLSVLLCKGSPSAKASVLFEVFDKNSNGILEKAEVDQMLDDLFTLAVDKLSKLAAPSDESNPYSKEDFDAFIEKAHHGIGRARKQILGELGPEENKVNKAEFEAWAKKLTNSEWFTSTGIRTKLKKLGKRELRAIRKAKETEEQAHKDPAEGDHKPEGHPPGHHAPEHHE